MELTQTIWTVFGGATFCSGAQFRQQQLRKQEVSETIK
jgi:hypothetical protein